MSLGVFFFMLVILLEREAMRIFSFDFFFFFFTFLSLYENIHFQLIYYMIYERADRKWKSNRQFKIDQIAELYRPKGNRFHILLTICNRIYILRQWTSTNYAVFQFQEFVLIFVPQKEKTHHYWMPTIRFVNASKRGSFLNKLELMWIA